MKNTLGRVANSSYPHQPERRLVKDIAFQMLAADNQPNFRTISLEAGTLKVGRVALDGTKVKANASKHKAMSYDRMKKKEEDLRSQIKEM